MPHDDCGGGVLLVGAHHAHAELVVRHCLSILRGCLSICIRIIAAHVRSGRVATRVGACVEVGCHGGKVRLHLVVLAILHHPVRVHASIGTVAASGGAAALRRGLPIAALLVFVFGALTQAALVAHRALLPGSGCWGLPLEDAILGSVAAGVGGDWEPLRPWTGQGRTRENERREGRKRGCGPYLCIDRLLCLGKPKNIANKAAGTKDGSSHRAALPHRGNLLGQQLPLHAILRFGGGARDALEVKVFEVGLGLAALLRDGGCIVCHTGIISSVEGA